MSAANCDTANESASNGHSAAGSQDLVSQRLDFLDRALLGLLPRVERLEMVARVEARILELGVAEGVTERLTRTNLLDAVPDLGRTSNSEIPSRIGRRRSRLAVSAGAAGVFSLGLLVACPVMYVLVGVLAQVLGEGGALGILGLHVIAMAAAGLAAVGFGAVALLRILRRTNRFGHGWAIAGMCTGMMPLLVGGLLLLIVGSQLIGQVSTDLPVTAVPTPALSAQMISPVYGGAAAPAYKFPPVAAYAPPDMSADTLEKPAATVAQSTLSRAQATPEYNRAGTEPTSLPPALPVASPETTPDVNQHPRNPSVPNPTPSVEPQL